MALKVLSLFSGVGGLEIAAEMAGGFEVVALCEQDKFAQSILRKRFPGIPIFSDIRTLTRGDIVGAVDVVCGGFPCQDLSCAGKQSGFVDADGNITRSGLWYEMLRIVREFQPRYVVAENVRGAVNIALDECKANLEAIGYKVWSIVIPASAFGAPHKRERLCIFGKLGNTTSA